MRIIIIGQGPFGEKVLEAFIRRGEELVGVFCPPDKRGEAMKKLAEKSFIPLFQPAKMKDPRVYEDYIRLRPDLVLLAFVTDIIPARLLDIPTFGSLCYHPSLLPRHRGASGINWAIIQGDTRTGLTIFWADRGIDTGPILLQKEVEIGPNETTGSLYFNTLFPMGVEAMAEAVDLVRKGEAPRIPQDESEATYEPPCDDRVACIDFKKSGREIFNLIRGCDPQPGAYIDLRGMRVRFYDAALDLTQVNRPPGRILSIDEDGLWVALKDGRIRIGKLKQNNGDKIGPLDFARSVGWKIGDRLVHDKSENH